MKKYGIKLALAAAVFCMAMPFASFAGTWKSDANGMWYQFDDGTYPKGRWAWIDTDNDGMAESFYFDSNGYVLRNTTTPDGYQVNRIGAWVVGGEVKQKAGGETKKDVYKRQWQYSMMWTQADSDIRSERSHSSV